MILIINTAGHRVCNDNCWRHYAYYGNLRGCVQQYRRLSNARYRAKQVKGFVVQIPDGMSVDAVGTVIETIPCEDKPGYVNYKHHALAEFKI